MNLKTYTRVYFIGIGGIGMSAIARYFNQKGYEVAGYDKTSTPLTSALIKEGIQVHFEDKLSNIHPDFKNIEKTLVVYTPAVPENHSQLNYFKDNKFDVHKRAYVVAQIANQGKCIAVAGTHGKTTTSSLIAHILKTNKKSVTAFLGGISTNYNTNLIIGKAKEVVIEADEYDRSFLNLRPHLAVLTSMDADHLDIYEQSSELEKSFKAFLALVKPDGVKIVNAKLEQEGISYSINGPADYQGVNIHISKGDYYFDVVHKDKVWPTIKCGLAGRHNVENALAAAAACNELGVSIDIIAKGIETFEGVHRRFQYHVNTDKVVYIDDYAHHPKELEMLLASAKELYPNKKITTVFQPHLFSRTKDFADEFAQALSATDELLLLDIYPAREEPLPGITSEWLLEKINCSVKRITNAKELNKEVASLNPELVITAGAGDIDKCVIPLATTLGSL